MEDSTVMVEINGELASFIPSYLESVRQDCALMEHLLDRGDFKEIEGMGHRLKGSGGSCGFDAISDAGKAVERAAAALDGDAVSLACQGLRRYLDQVRVVYV